MFKPKEELKMKNEETLGKFRRVLFNSSFRILHSAF